MASLFEDERGLIEDLLGPVDGITEIFTRKGAVRGNHVHDRTTQWVYVVSGCLLTAVREPSGHVRATRRAPGELVREEAGVPHAWKALEDTRVLVFTRGPRTGEGFESDVRRLPAAERVL